MQSDKQKTAGKGKKVRGGFKTSRIAEMFEYRGLRCLLVALGIGLVLLLIRIRFGRRRRVLC